MLQAQINYWNYVEQKRHNLATEALSEAANAINASQASTAKFNAVTNRLAYEEGVRHDKSTEGIDMIKAIAAQTQAGAAVEQAKIGWKNAETNAFNAQVNYMNALTNQENAISNRMQAYASQTQAAVAVGQLQVNRQLADSQIALNQSQIGLNTSNVTLNFWKNQQIQAETDLTKAKTEVEVQKAYQSYIDSNWYKVEKWLNAINSGTSSWQHVAGNNAPGVALNGILTALLP